MCMEMGWKSRRLILAGDGLKYSVHETTLDAGVDLNFKYEAHRETVYCMEGEGSITNVATGQTWPITAGTLYTVGIGDTHIVRSNTGMKLLCIFDPPLAGQEEAN